MVDMPSDIEDTPTAVCDACGGSGSSKEHGFDCETCAGDGWVFVIERAAQAAKQGEAKTQ